jgi:hypothetical protein
MMKEFAQYKILSHNEVRIYFALMVNVYRCMGSLSLCITSITMNFELNIFNMKV